MLFISHRGNLTGPNPLFENHPLYIKETLNKGYFVEVDVWLQNEKCFLGHDSPDYEVDLNFFENDRIICHAKNSEALAFLIRNNIHCFSHDKDDVVLTSRGWLWTFPGKPLTPQSVAVMPEREPNWNISKCYAVCSDYVTFSNP